MWRRMVNFLANLKAKLSEPSVVYLDSQITATELSKAVQQMKANKSPWPDGITPEFYKQYWDKIKGVFLEIVRDIYHQDELSYTQYQAIISLLDKKGIRENIISWRPISLLNSDYKIITKVLAMRLKKVMHEIIHEDQRGCIKGRHGHECLRILEDVIENGIDENSCFLLIDQEKAFDRVETKWLFNVLEGFGFGQNFIKWIRILYKYAQSAIITNGVISRYFSVERGIRQGDSLSALLYIIQAKPMAQAIRDSDSMEGIHTKSMEGEWIEYRLTQYADDTTIILKHFDMIQTALDLLKKFGTASGSKLNVRKTKCLIFQQSFPPGFDVQFTTGPEIVLGIPVGGNCNMSEHWKKKIDKISKSLAVWKTRNLTFKGKTELIQSMEFSNVLYIMEVKNLNHDEIMRISSSLWNFLWDGKKRGLVKREICMLPKKWGGLGMPDLQVIMQAKRIIFVKNTILGHNEKWKVYPRKYFSSLDRSYNMKYFLLNVTDSIPHLQNRHIPYFYLKCIEFYQKNVRIAVPEPTNARDVMGQILWHNHFIKFNGKSLDYKHWARCGLIRVDDVLEDFKLCPNKIKRKLRITSNFIFEFEILRKAIPKK